MSTNLYNYTNQKFKADELRLINSFNSYNYAGIVAKSSPLVRNGNKILLQASDVVPVVFLGGGLLIKQTSNLELDLSIDHNLVYMKIILDNDYGSIITDEYDGISIESTGCNYVSFDAPFTLYTLVDKAEGNPVNNHYYEYIYNEDRYVLSSDTTVVPSKVYYIRYDSNNFSFRSSTFGNAIYKYNGNTIWIDSKTFIIPLAIRDGSNYREVVCVKDLKDLSEFLSLDAYARLKNYCEGTFVWSVGGEEEVVAPDGTIHKKGDIGSLNITGNLIKNKNSDEAPVEISRLALSNLKNSTDKDRLIVDSEGKLDVQKDYKVPVQDGGTYLESNWDINKPRYSAKKNLGIWYGKNDPTNQYPFNPAVEGDIYLKIIE